MNRLSVYAAAFFMLIGINPQGWAEEATPAHGEYQNLLVVKERLQLTDDQLQKIAPVLKQSVEARRSILSRYGIDYDAPKRPQEKLGLRNAMSMKRELNAAKIATQMAVSDILTKEQMEEFKRLQEEQKEKFRSRMLERGTD